MKQRLAAISLLCAFLVVCLTGAALAQDTQDTMPARPMFGHLPPNLQTAVLTPSTPLTTWNGSFVFQGVTYKYNMVGTAPSTGTSTTVTAFLIPINLVFKTTTGTVTFSPSHKLSNGQTVVQNTVASPIFKSGIDFVQGGTNLGNTQYIDAFQRGNFWSIVSTHTGYHLLLGGPTVLATQTLNVPSNEGKVGTEFGIRVGLVNVNWFDAQVQAIMKRLTQIQPNTLPIFITYDSYLIQNKGCCIGGYHSAFSTTSGIQSYAHFTYIARSGAFAQDVSALSHEVGEWADDPVVVNNGNPTKCGALEVGDPEENAPNFGAFPYTLGGFTYNLQDLTWLPYFGAPTSTSANHSLTFQGNPFGLTVCSAGS